MPRSHPPTLLKLVERCLREECALPPSPTILVAVSGGADSTALLHVLHRVAPRLGARVVAHGVDHGLRDEAGRELDGIQELARELGMPFGRSRVQLEPGSNLQARCRAARYRALRAAATEAGANLIATAHQADDRAETVLLRLLRGAGPGGLAVLPARAGELLRPLIRATRNDVLAHLMRHRLVWAEDPSNRDRRFARARIRHELLPLLRELSPQIVPHLNALADQLSAVPSSVVLDAEGSPLTLGRAQRLQLARAQRLRQLGTRIPLRGGRELGLDRRTGRPVVRPSKG